MLKSDQDSGRQARLDSVGFGPIESRLDYRKVVNVVIAKNFNLAQEDVQIQALEVLIISSPATSEYPSHINHIAYPTEPHFQPHYYPLYS